MDGTFGDMLRTWRQRRRVTQLDLSLEAGLSQRHLSFVETGRSFPSRDMVLRLAEALAVPLRDRNAMLTTAGFAPCFKERALDDPDLKAAMVAVDLLLTGHEPYPALAVDRHWTLKLANRSVAPLLAGIPDALLEPPVNVLRLSLHPDGLAPRIRNYRQWRHHILARLSHQIDVSGDPVLIALLDELTSFPVTPGARPFTQTTSDPLGGIAVPLELTAADDTILRFLSTTTVFGKAVDISLSELTIESFFPADIQTAEVLRRGSP